LPSSRILMKNRRNYYRILQVQPDAPSEIIRASYRTLMSKMKQHPDLGGSSCEAAILNEAYQTLGNPKNRAAYDKALFEHYSKRADIHDKRTLTARICPVCRKALARQPQPGEYCLTCHTPLHSEKVPKISKISRRSLTRMKKDQPILYYATWPGQARQGEMVDFSPEGMQFICSERLEPKTVLRISNPIFEASGVVTNLRARVVNGQT
jgi:curved DNA-binding protein CbpA